MSKKPIIKVSHLVKKYRKATTNAVDDISFTINQGDFFALLGPNGAGKTTIISILTTTLTKTSGTVQIAGFDLDKNSSGVRQNIGIIFQNPSLDLNLTSEENIRLHAALYGLYPFRPSFDLMPEGYKKQVYQLADILGIRDQIFKQAKTLSGGMKRKMEIIRSLMHHPKVLFLDEPTSGLDPVSRRDLWSYLVNIKKNENTTIFLTTHYLEEAEDADQVCIINNGKIVALGTPNEIKSNLVEEYILLDAKERKKLQQELEKLHLDFTQEDDGVIKVNLKNTTAQKVIKKLGVNLSYLRIHNPSLEEAYLEIIEESKKSE